MERQSMFKSLSQSRFVPAPNAAISRYMRSTSCEEKQYCGEGNAYTYQFPHAFATSALGHS